VDEISTLNARALAISVDTEHCHYAFLQREFPAAAAKFPLSRCPYNRVSRYNFFFFAAICLSDPIQCIVTVCIKLLNLFFLLVADTTKRITRDFQVLDEETGVARRSLIVIDKRGEIRYWSVLQHHEIEHNFDSVLSLVRTLLFHFFKVNRCNTTLSNRAFKPVEAFTLMIDARM
jgi:alkyl hydroperoxide reductase subunit AhpC